MFLNLYPRCLPLVWGALLVGCARQTTWDGQIRHWGTLREVLHDGHTEGRVELVTAARAPHTYGIGAMEGLYGEVVILDSRIWVAQAGEAHGPATVSASCPADRATLLITARVPHWTEQKLTRDVSAAGFDRTIREMADDAGLKAVDTVPFLIEGTLTGLHMHIVNGGCPMNASDGDKDAPIRTVLAQTHGTLVGIITNAEPGIMTHHGSQTHVHALLDGPPRAAGHVDSVGLQAGATVRFPKM